MASLRCVLRLYLLDDRQVDLGRVALLIDRLGARRTVRGRPPEWRVLYEGDDLSEAMRMCAADLDELDPGWLEILDFKARSTRRLRSARPA